MRNRRRLLSEGDSTREIWPAFTDVMSTMAIIMFVLVLLAYVRNLINEKQLAASRAQIALSNRDLEKVRAEVAIGKKDLEASRFLLRDQEATIAESNRQLGTLRTQLQNIAVLRVSVLEKIKNAIETQLGSSHPTGGQAATIRDNGDIAVNESLVFEYNSYAIKKQARPVLDALARALFNLLSDDDVRTNIDTIVIQGHADARGSASFNWDLSAKRSTAVLDYLFQSNKTLAENYGSYFAAAAYSKFRPVDTDTSEEAFQQNRRIEISVIPKDSSLRKVVDEYLATPNPAPAPER
jgi:chemotaxis protein MotB